jgi:hypothetical protein
MFVKILTKRNKNTVRETIYECENVTVAPDGDSVKVKMEPEGKEVVIPFEGQISIYLMNQQGKTIDTFRFGERK